MMPHTSLHKYKYKYIWLRVSAHLYDFWHKIMENRRWRAKFWAQSATEQTNIHLCAVQRADDSTEKMGYCISC